VSNELAFQTRFYNQWQGRRGSGPPSSVTATSTREGCGTAQTCPGHSQVGAGSCYAANCAPSCLNTRSVRPARTSRATGSGLQQVFEFLGLSLGDGRGGRGHGASTNCWIRHGQGQLGGSLLARARHQSHRAQVRLRPDRVAVSVACSAPLPRASANHSSRSWNPPANAGEQLQRRCPARCARRARTTRTAGAARPQSDRTARCRSRAQGRAIITDRKFMPCTCRLFLRAIR